MRNRLTTILILLLAGCDTIKETTDMSTTNINGVRLSFTGPDSLPLSVVSRDSPSYDGPRNYFTVTLTNETNQPCSLPFDELRRNVVLVYRNDETGQERIDNRTPPPKMDGSVEAMAPGKTQNFQVVFEYPADIATMKEKVAELTFCVRWKKDWLRDKAYAAGAFNWNESYELCRKIQIVSQ